MGSVHHRLLIAHFFFFFNRNKDSRLKQWILWFKCDQKKLFSFFFLLSGLSHCWQRNNKLFVG